MWGNYLAAALRNLSRNRLYAGVTIAGLAIGFAAAMLIGLYVRHEFSYDRFVPGHERVFRISETIASPGSPAFESDSTPMMLAKPLKEEFAEFAWVARLSPSYFPPDVRRGDVVAGEEHFFWADPDFFKVMPLPVVAGDLATALEAPDSIVLTRQIARKYFGKDAPIGEVLTINREPMRVTAVIEDLPSNSHLTALAIASIRSPQSPVSQYEAVNDAMTNTLATYVRLKPGASVASIEPRLPEFLERRLPLHPALEANGKFRRVLHLVPLADIHMRPSDQGAFKPPVQPAVMIAIGVVGVLVVIVAAINFVTLMTARAARRAVEVGVRKAAGASRRDLFVQFMGEAFVYVLLAGALALALAELALPAFNRLLQRRIILDYVNDPALALAVVVTLSGTALLAGAYPAIVMSSFRPAAVLKGGPAPVVGGAQLRQALVIAQFAVLIALALGAITIARQTLFALNDGMRLNQDQVVLVFMQRCSEAMRDEVRTLAGVQAAACARSDGIDLSDVRDLAIVEGRRREIGVGGIDIGLLELFGVRPIAGRFLDPARPGDRALDAPDSYPPVIINESAVRRLGFASPEAALGKTVLWHGVWDESMQREVRTIPPVKPSQIIGVAPDFTFGSVRQRVEPTMYSYGRNLPPYSVALAIKLNGKRTPETLAEIDRIWKRVSGGAPLLRIFADQFTMRLYLDTIIQGVTIVLAAVVALSIACLGLFALSAFTTERRTKEIGVRKAMGASSGDILKLLMWQFTKPVLWANLIAWPAAFFVLDWWLKGFANHVDLAPWTFAAAAAGAIAIAWATVFVHALKVARAKPVGALRYE